MSVSASYGTVQVGRLLLRETFELKTDVHASQGVRTVVITGEESQPPLPAAEVQQRHEDIMTMRDAVLPITWTNKSDHDGFYIVEDISATQINWTGEVIKFSWSIRATRIGPDNSVDIESRLTGIKRQNDFNQAGERWHAPAIGHSSYYTGSAQPSGSVDRASEDGTIKVYRSVPASVNPRWAIPAASYQQGRVRLMLSGVERTGTNMRTTPTNWALKNGLVNVAPASSGGLLVGAWDGAGYDTKFWNLGVGASATPLTSFDSVAVIRNDFEMATIKLLKTRFPGRTSLTLNLRRGSRFVEGYLTTDFSTTLAVWTNTLENSTSPASSGYVVATNDDADGVWGIVGTTKVFQTHSSNVRLHRTAVTAQDFYLGAVMAGQPLNANPFFEVDVANWFPVAGTFVRSTAQFHQGVASGLLTPNGVAAVSEVKSEQILGVSAGQSLIGTAWVRCAVSRNVKVHINWLDSGAVNFATTSSVDIPVTANVWTPISLAATAPATTESAGLVAVSLNGTPPAGHTTHVDEAKLRVAVASGDLAADLQAQYIRAMAEFTMAVRR